MLIDFHDAEEMSRALRHTNVSAMQISRGRFRAQLGVVLGGDWTLQHIRFLDGVTACAGDGPLDRCAFIVPLRPAAQSRLLGRQIGESSLGIYAPGSEHSDVSLAGYEQVVLMPPPQFAAGRANGPAPFWLPENGSHHTSLSVHALARLRAVLANVVSCGAAGEMPVLGDELRRSLNDEIGTALSAALGQEEDETNRGRPPLPRAAIIRQLKDILDTTGDAPAYAGELAQTVGVSDATLRRMFVELFGMPPSRYLMLKRLNLARRLLRNGVHETVGQVAAACGFWDHSRFAGRYRALFGEAPVETLRQSRRAASIR